MFSTLSGFMGIIKSNNAFFIALDNLYDYELLFRNDLVELRYQEHLQSNIGEEQVYEGISINGTECFLLPLKVQ